MIKEWPIGEDPPPEIVRLVPTDATIKEGEEIAKEIEDADVNDRKTFDNDD